MRPIRRGDRGPAVAEIRAILVGLDLLPAGRPATPTSSTHATERAVRAFQQDRGLSVDGEVGAGDLAGAGRRPLAARRPHALPRGARPAASARTSGRCRSGCWRWGTTSAGPTASTAPGPPGRWPSSSARSGSRPDGVLRPADLNALRRLGRKVVGGRPQWLREARARSGSPARAWSARPIVIDPGHGGTDPGVVVPDGPLRWTEADLAYDLAARLEGRLAAAGMRVHLTRGPAAGDAAARPRPGRAGQRTRRRPAHLAAHRRPRQPGGGRAWPPTTTAPTTG